MNIVERIETLCNIKGLSIAALERAVDLSNGSIRRWLINKPSVDKLTKVADYFNVSVDYLLGREEVELPEVYLRLAREAQNLGLDKDDVDAILNLYKSHKEKNK